eukprot:722274-Rhodomonas_salina.1
MGIDALSERASEGRKGGKEKGGREGGGEKGTWGREREREGRKKGGREGRGKADLAVEGATGLASVLVAPYSMSVPDSA